MSKLVDIADEVVDLLNNWDGSSNQFTAERLYIPIYDLKITKDLVVYVLALGESTSMFTRSEHESIYNIKIAIYKATTFDDIAAVDAMNDFREGVLDLLKVNRNLIESGGIVKEITNNPVYDPAQLEKFNTFVSIIDLQVFLIS